jgi:hypothetical protein
MARRRRQNAGSAFADAFSSARTMVRDVRQGLKTDEIMEEEVIESEGEDGTKSWSYGGNTYDHAIKGRELRGLQLDRIEDMYLDMGDTDKLFGMVKTRADNKTTRLANNLTEETFDDNVKTPGLENKKIEAETGSTNSLEDWRRGLLPGAIKKQDAETSSLAASAEFTNVKTAGQKISNASSQQDFDKNNEFNKAIIKHRKQATDGVFKSEKEAATAWRDMVGLFDPPSLIKLNKEFNDDELGQIVHEGQMVSAEVQQILSTEGLPGIVKYIDEENGYDAGAKVITVDGEMQLVATYPEGHEKAGEPMPDGVVARGQNKEQLMANLQYFGSPEGSTKLAAQMFSFKRETAEIEKITAQAKLYGVQADQHVLDKYKTEVTNFMGSQAYFGAKASNKGAEALKEWTDEFWKKVKADGTGLAGGALDIGDKKEFKGGTVTRTK